MFIGSGLVFFIAYILGLVYLFKDQHWAIGLLGVIVPIIPVVYIPYRFLAHNLPDDWKVKEILPPPPKASP